MKSTTRFVPVLAFLAIVAGGCKPLGSFGQQGNNTNTTINQCIVDDGCKNTPATPMCTGGYCTGSCGVDSDCQNLYGLPAHFSCNTSVVNGRSEHRCREKCTQDANCPVTAPVCQNGFCFPSSCSMTCAAGTHCSNGQCVMDSSTGGGLGAPCGGSNQACTAGLICSSRGLCSDRSIGQPCTLANECSTGACINNTCQKCTLDAHCPGSTCNLATGVCNNASTCGAGQTLCNGACFTLASDVNNCGGCGVKCAVNQTCQSGACVVMMGCGTTGNASCNNACVDTRRDPNNCGGCGIICQNGTFCANSVCTGDLNALRVRCNDGQKDGDETATDCGGSCALLNQLCTANMGCMLNGDCWDWGTGVPLACNGSVCVCPQGKTPKTVTGLNGRLVTSCQ